MHPQKQMEEYGHGWLHALAAAAGYGYEPTRVDLDSIDAAIFSVGPDDTKRRPRVELQLKCTTQFSDVQPDADIRFPLEAKNYRDLRIPNVLVPRILVVVLMPRDVAHWVETRPEETNVRRRAHWLSLRNWPESTNKTSVTVTIPGCQLLTPESIKSMMQRVDGGDAP